MTDATQPPDYVQMILAKTRNDRRLAFTIFSQLFQEMPELIHAIQDDLSLQRYDQARDSVHKLHGALRVAGLDNIQVFAEQLEHCLVDKRYADVNRHWFQLQRNLFTFSGNKKALLNALSDNL